jgi:hypothetical protein
MLGAEIKPRHLDLVSLKYEINPTYSAMCQESQCAQKSSYLIDSSINQEGYTNQSIKSSLV